MRHIKYTTSVCPRCLKYLDAQVLEEPDGIFLSRTCQEHGAFYDIVETDIDFYKAAANIGKKRFIEEANFLVMPITDNCNQRCKFCFYPSSGNKHMPAEQVVDIAGSGPATICLSGGEPTLHPDLPQILRKLESMGKRTQLLTNGLKFADPGLVKDLKAAGLKRVLFSLNGFSDQILEQIDNAPCLQQKLKAFENLKNQGISVELSISLLRGVNEGELKKAFEFCFKNIDCIFGLRVRSFSQVGRSQEVSTLTSGEMNALVSDALGVKKEKLINGIKKRRFSSSRQYNAVLCFLKISEEFIFLSELDPYFSGLMKNSSFRLLAAVFKTINTGGLRIFLKVLFKILSGKGKISWLSLNMYSWPDKYSLDMEEIYSTGGAHLNSKNEIGNFLKVLILDKSD